VKIRLPKQPQRIALIKPSALGDIAHTLPVLSALRQLYPRAHITWVVNTLYAPLIHGHPHLNAVLPFNRSAYRKPAAALAYSWHFAKQLKRAKFDLVLDVQGLLRTGIMTATTAAPVRLGFANAREGSRHVYTHRITAPNIATLHAVDRYWLMIEALGGGHLTKQFHLTLDPVAKQTMAVQLTGLPKPWIAVAPGARWLTKRWPLPAFAELLKRTHDQYRGTVVLVGAPDDIALSSELAQQLAFPVVNLTGRTSMAELAALLGLMDLMISNDTGPLHLAAALGVACLGVYLCTQVQRHGPYAGANTANRGVATTVACAGSYHRVCPQQLECMTELTAERLWPHWKEHLDTWIQQYHGSTACRLPLPVVPVADGS
jgi:lipopolysaccharide heptosyltransferase I